MIDGNLNLVVDCLNVCLQYLLVYYVIAGELLTLSFLAEITSSAVQQLLRQSQPTAQRPPIVASSGVSADGHQTSPSLSPPSPPLEVVRCSSLLSGTPTRPPHIGSISPITNNLQLGSGIRAPAPHLQPFRPSASLSTTGLSSFLHGMPSQQVPSTSPTLSEIPSRALQQSGPSDYEKLL